MNSTKGVTLLELVIAIFVLSIGTVAALRSVDHAQRNIGGAAARIFAAQAALNRAEEIKLLGMTRARALPVNIDYGPYSWSINVDEEETRAGFVEATVTTRSPGQPGGQAVVIAKSGEGG
ncbi:type IV pilus modification PilV family protein [Roseovarius litorisediminis]|nr:prepilin-type N-terminal cleavage/methylation domain-containing protein [Roseovarius litorisediminis]